MLPSATTAKRALTFVSLSACPTARRAVRPTLEIALIDLNASG
jgi:hypothetical protein